MTDPSKINLEIGARPEIAWVPVSKIIVDHNYQRELSDRRVNRILAKFNWRYFQPITVSRQPDGTFAVYDGQHRVKAAELHPNVTEVPALIVDMDGMQAEADAFVTVNTERTAVSAVERYWAGVTAENPEMLRIQKVLADADCEVSPTQGMLGYNMTNAVGALQRAINRNGEKPVRHALRSLRNAWPNEKMALKGTLITALSRVYCVNPKLDPDRLHQALGRQPLHEMTASAEAIRKISGGTAETAIARAVCEAYNRGLKKNIIYFGVEQRGK